MLFGLRRLLPLALLPVLGKPQCGCQWTYHHYLIEVDKNYECEVLYDEVRAYYCGSYQWTYYYYLGYYCNELGPMK